MGMVHTRGCAGGSCAHPSLVLRWELCIPEPYTTPISVQGSGWWLGQLDGQWCSGPSRQRRARTKVWEMRAITENWSILNFLEETHLGSWVKFNAGCYDATQWLCTNSWTSSDLLNPTKGLLGMIWHSLKKPHLYYRFYKLTRTLSLWRLVMLQTRNQNYLGLSRIPLVTILSCLLHVWHPFANQNLWNVLI